MYQAINISLIIAILSILVSCQATRNEKKNEESPGKPQQSTMAFTIPSTIAPDHCRILATVVAIDSALNTAATNDPCAKAPCNATVRIDSLLGYGSGFPAVFSKGQEISVRFAFTTAPTAGLFPEMSPGFPGVQAGAKILADVEGGAGMPAMEGASGGANFTIYEYEVK